MTDTTALSQPQETAAPMPVQLKPKNTHRLNRIFRKPKATVAPRQWRVVAADGDASAADEEAGKPGTANTRRSFAGVSLKAIREMVADLTDSEKARAAAREDPLSATQEELQRRAQRFGVLVAPAGTTAVVADPEELRAREARFGTAPAGLPMDGEMQRRLARFGAAPAPTRTPVVLQLSEEDKAAMEARAKRFGA